MEQIYRQGDVLLRRIEALPENAKPLAPTNGRHVLELGEATGHAHTVLERAADLYATPAGGQYLQVTTETPLTHEEHGAIVLEPGIYERWYQVEGDPEDERQVAD